MFPPSRGTEGGGCARYPRTNEVCTYSILFQCSSFFIAHIKPRAARCADKIETSEAMFHEIRANCSYSYYVYTLLYYICFPIFIYISPFEGVSWGSLTFIYWYEVHYSSPKGNEVSCPCLVQSIPPCPIICELTPLHK